MVFSARLPTLLSQLPKNGQQALVRPITGNPNKLWLVTRTKLRFKPTASASASGSTDNPTDKGKGKGKGKDEGEEGVDGAVAVGGEPLKAFGRVWGMCYYHGKYQPPKTKTSLPDPLLPKPSSSGWIQINPNTLPSSHQDELKKWKGTLSLHSTKRDEVRSELVARLRKEREEHESLMDEREVWRRERMERDLRVEILY